MNSILLDIKKMLGLSDEYTAFDTDIIIHINSAFMILNQLGVGPEKPYMIFDESQTWLDFTSDMPEVASAKTYVYLRVKLLFDPPSSSFVLESINKQIAELEWRLKTQKEVL